MPEFVDSGEESETGCFLSPSLRGVHKEDIHPATKMHTYATSLSSLPEIVDISDSSDLDDSFGACNLDALGQANFKRHGESEGDFSSAVHNSNSGLSLAESEVDPRRCASSENLQ